MAPGKITQAHCPTTPVLSRSVCLRAWSPHALAPLSLRSRSSLAPHWLRSRSSLAPPPHSQYLDVLPSSDVEAFQIRDLTRHFDDGRDPAVQAVVGGSLSFASSVRRRNGNIERSLNTVRPLFMQYRGEFGDDPEGDLVWALSSVMSRSWGKVRHALV